MTLTEFQRALLAEFAAREAGERGSVEEMRAIAICLRNRVKMGWTDCVLRAIEDADSYRANLVGPRVALDPDARSLQRFLREVDDVYYGSKGNAEVEGGNPGETMEDALAKCCFWQKLNEPVSAWFRENVIDQPELHPIRAQMGMTIFYE